MSFKEDWSELREPFKNMLKPTTKAAFLFQSGSLMELASESLFRRGIAPEPFDFPSHIGNFREGAMGSMAAFAMIGIFTMFPALADNSRELFRRNARRTAIAAFAVSSAVQVVGEKYELTNGLVQNTGDPLDAVYGIAWSAAVALGTYKLAVGEEQAHYARGLAQEQVATDNMACE